MANFQNNTLAVQDTEKRFPDLDEVLAYRNDDVVDGLLRSLSITKDEAESLFREGLKWLWYCNHPDTRNFRSIDSCLLIIDEVWHTFILYTNDYSKFCWHYFGHFIHHQPTTPDEIARQNEIGKEQKHQTKRRQMELMYEILGKETFIRWYHVYSDTYSRESLLKLRKK